MADAYEGNCLECGKPYTGRSNRKFCSDKCKRKAAKLRERLATLESERAHLRFLIDFQKREGSALDVRYLRARLSRVAAMIEKTSPESSPQTSLICDESNT